MANLGHPAYNYIYNLQVGDLGLRFGPFILMFFFYKTDIMLNGLDENTLESDRACDPGGVRR